MSSSLSKDAIQLKIFKKIHIKGVNFGLIFQLTSLILFIHQPPEVFCKTGILRNFAKLTGKHICKILFFNEVAGLSHWH